MAAIRESSWLVVAAVVAVAAGYPVLVWSNFESVLALTRPVADATGGLVHPTLLVYAPALLVVIGGLMVWLGGLRLRDVGLRRADLRTGVLVTVGVWLFMQVVGAAVLLWNGLPVQLNPTWTTAGALAVIGALVSQLFGNALYEEVVFRAFLLNQLQHTLQGRLTVTPRWSLLAALVGSQAIFALMHVPNRLVSEGLALAQLGPTLALLFVWGSLLALVYYRTGNLFVAIGIHAFMNTPTMLVGPPDAGVLTAIGLAIVLVVVWPWVEWFTGRARSRAPDESGQQPSD